jgi:hypothetical protein
MPGQHRSGSPRVHQQDQRDHLEPAADREQPRAVLAGGYQQHQRSRDGTGQRVGAGRRCNPTSVLCSRLGFIATMAAIGIHQPCGWFI